VIEPSRQKPPPAQAVSGMMMQYRRGAHWAAFAHEQSFALDARQPNAIQIWKGNKA